MLNIRPGMPFHATPSINIALVAWLYVQLQLYVYRRWRHPQVRSGPPCLIRCCAGPSASSASLMGTLVLRVQQMPSQMDDEPCLRHADFTLASGYLGHFMYSGGHFHCPSTIHISMPSWLFTLSWRLLFLWHVDGPPHLSGTLVGKMKTFVPSCAGRALPRDAKYYHCTGGLAAGGRATWSSGLQLTVVAVQTQTRGRAARVEAW